MPLFYFDFVQNLVEMVKNSPLYNSCWDKAFTPIKNEIKYIAYLNKELYFSEGKNYIFNYQIKVF